MTNSRIITILAALMLTTPAYAATNQEEAVTKTGHAVITQDGDCVRTKWQADSDPCAPEMPKKEVAYVAPVPKLSREQRTVYFEFNKSYLNEEGKEKLDSLIQHILTSKGIRNATVLGYADEIGKPDANLALSKRRAASVQGYLASKVTIPTNVMMVEGEGETNSVTSCPETMKRKARISCLAADRRVEVTFNAVR